MRTVCSPVARCFSPRPDAVREKARAETPRYDCGESSHGSNPRSFGFSSVKPLLAASSDFR